MRKQDFSRDSLEPFDNVAVIKRYFASVKAMDRAAVAGKAFDIRRIMALWQKGGELSIAGKQLGGTHTYSGTRQIASFYRKRAKGVDSEISFNLSSIKVAKANRPNHVVASGTRHVVTHNDEGLGVPFAHNFTLADGKIAALEIKVGEPTSSEIAPLGELEIEDMGRLSAVAWMVA